MRPYCLTVKRNNFEVAIRFHLGLTKSSLMLTPRNFFWLHSSVSFPTGPNRNTMLLTFTSLSRPVATPLLIT